MRNKTPRARPAARAPLPGHVLWSNGASSYGSAWLNKSTERGYSLKHNAPSERLKPHFTQVDESIQSLFNIAARVPSKFCINGLVKLPRLFFQVQDGVLRTSLAPPSSSHSSPSPPLACFILTGEREFLFPPGSFLQPAGAETVRAVDGVTIVPLRIAANLKVRACSGAVLEDSAVRCLTRRNVCAGADGRGAGG